MHVPPASRLYDPIYVEPSLKEYETQVLQMSVPIDDEASYDGHDIAKLNGKLSLRGLMRNISYTSRPMSRDRAPNDSPEATTTSSIDKAPSTVRADSALSSGNLRQSKNPLYCELS